MDNYSLPCYFLRRKRGKSLNKRRQEEEEEEEKDKQMISKRGQDKVEFC